MLQLILLAILPPTIVVMLPPRLPYDIPWTAKLLRRDIRHLQTKYTTKLKFKLKAPRTASHSDNDPKTEGSGGLQLGGASLSSPSERTACSTPPSSPDTAHDGMETPTTLYALLERNLKATYAARDHNVSHRDRWRFRGSWLLLNMAIQACPSNDSYIIFRDGGAPPNEGKTLLEMLGQSTSGIRKQKVSKMPAELFSKVDGDRDERRNDSMFSDNDAGPAVAASSTKAAHPPPPPPAHIWLAILDATSDAIKMLSVAEEMLGYVWPEWEATDVIERIGNPQKCFSDADADQLRGRFRTLLFPEYELLFHR
ncbi:hypothetical protein BDW02DRAFT_597412 [Decorospora gaudefroyi]|uniref:Uncharacterized protein n=1 Tax=Decorospora gaudefroyi TaxID=184978 RepID=A0A6A5KI95_9PLEO|nr:hypothetical protein BDW02DRAFT_597412 [Decorospora gaudefroyi]